MKIYNLFLLFLARRVRILKAVVNNITSIHKALRHKTIFSKRDSGMFLWLDLDTWNILMQILLGATAFAAIGLFVAQRAVIVLQDEADIEAKQALDKYKSNSAKLISDANARGEEAKTKALEAQLALEKFRAPRVLSAEQQQAIIGALKKFQGQEYAGEIGGGIPDASVLWHSIDNALLMAGWIRLPPPGMSIGNSSVGISLVPPVGIAIITREDDLPVLAGRAMPLVIELKRAGIEATLSIDVQNVIRAKSIVIQIGPKT